MPHDPIMIALGCAGTIIGALAVAIWGFVLSQMKRTQAGVDKTNDFLGGENGLHPRMAKMEVRQNSADAAIDALQTSTLPRELFLASNREQNVILDGNKAATTAVGGQVDKLSVQVEKLVEKVVRIDLAIIQPPTLRRE
jgi:hypothetical protein